MKLMQRVLDQPGGAEFNQASGELKKQLQVVVETGDYLVDKSVGSWAAMAGL